MIYFFTGQPGHGKTLHAIDLACDFRDKGRIVYVCNVRDFDYEKAKMLPLSPEEFRDWMQHLPDGAVCLVDECYEKGMLTKTPPAAPVPRHIEQLAVHRHRGIDFIFVCQSPDRQVHSFVHDLIERHVHVRRRFGTSFVHLRTYDKFERNPQKGVPLVLKRSRLPKRVFGLYKSTELDTTEKRIPWFYFVFVAMIAFAIVMTYYMYARLKAKGETPPESAPFIDAAARTGEGGAAAKTSPGHSQPSIAPVTAEEYALRFSPRIEGQPWTAPAYDHLNVPEQPPRVYCMSSGLDGVDSCTCITDQGTRYLISLARCRLIARHGQYEPFIDSRLSERNRQQDITQLRMIDDSRTRSAPTSPLPAHVQHQPAPSASVAFGSIHRYGSLELAPGAK